MRIVHRLHSNSVSDFGGFFFISASFKFSCEGGGNSVLDLCQLVAAQTCFYGIRKTKTHQANHREMSHCSKKKLVTRNELREIENIGTRDVNVFIPNFLLQVREFLFLNCV